MKEVQNTNKTLHSKLINSGISKAMFIEKKFYGGFGIGYIERPLVSHSQFRGVGTQFNGSDFYISRFKVYDKYYLLVVETFVEGGITHQIYLTKKSFHGYVNCHDFFEMKGLKIVERERIFFPSECEKCLIDGGFDKYEEYKFNYEDYQSTENYINFSFVTNLFEEIQKKVDEKSTFIDSMFLLPPEKLDKAEVSLKLRKNEVLKLKTQNQIPELIRRII